MKTKVYVRVGKSNNRTSRGRTYVDASKKVNHEPLYNASGAVPTIAFALDIEVPDSLFSNAERVAAEVKVTAKRSTVNVEVEAP